MSTPPAARNWVIFVALAASVALGWGLAAFETEPLSLPIALALCTGVVLATLLPIRYRFGRSTHAVTVDEPFLLAMLISLPPAWPPLLFAVGVLLGNVARRSPSRIPLIRVAFNVGSVALSATAATLVYEALRGDAHALDPRALAAVPVAMLAHIMVSTSLIGVLFARLKLSGFRQSVADVLAVGQVPYPFNVVAGIVLGWLATRGSVAAVLGVAIVIVFFVAYRASVSVRLQRVRAARLREVSTSLVTASGSIEAFDQALHHIGTLFGADSSELRLVGSDPRWVGLPEGADRSPSPAAIHGLTLDRAASLDPGSTDGGMDGALVAPLRDESGVVGVLVLHARRGLEPWDDADEDVLDGVAGEVLVALRNAELVEQIAEERSRLAAQSGLLGGILDAVSDGIAMVGMDGRVLAWNPGMSALAGLGTAEAMGRPFGEVFEAVDDRGEAATVSRDLALATSGATLARTWRISPPIGDERWARIVLTPVTDPDRPGVVVVARDVTAAREIDRVKADFIATVSHELRTPLTPLKGFLELADRRELTPEIQKEMRTSMRRQINRLESLVDDLLGMAELDRDLVDLAAVDVDLADVVERLPIAFQDAADRLVVGHGGEMVLGDIDALDRILTALVSNALKHTAGTVHVRVDDSDPARVTVEVSDEGPGIAIGDHEAIFERFHRLGDHLHRTQGPGLGLPIARALARRLGGDVEVESAPHRGSVFRLRLPRAGAPGTLPSAG